MQHKYRTMPEVSCFHIKNRITLGAKIIFIKFEKYFILRVCNYKQIILSFETFMKIPKLFEIYILSLLLTEHENKLWIRTKYLWKRDTYLYMYNDVLLGTKNILNKCEPKRETSNKKIKKFIKQFHYEFIYDNPLEYITKYINFEIRKTDEEIENLQIMVYKDNTIDILTGIRKKYGRDIYDVIRSHLI
jgi:hypothetical protein